MIIPLFQVRLVLPYSPGPRLISETATPGDSFVTDFEYYAPTTEWIDTYVLEPGTAGASAGETPSSGSLSPPASGTTFREQELQSHFKGLC